MSLILDPNNLVAEHIIQVSTVFKPNTSNILGSFNLWKKAGMFGKGDELLKFCPATGCKGFFSDVFTMSEREAEAAGDGDINSWPRQLQEKYDNWYSLPVICPVCSTVCIRENLPDSYGFNMQSSKIAERMSEFFNLLSGSADVYMVRTKQDSKFQEARNYLYSNDRSFLKYQKKVEAARDRDCVFYALKSIMKDTVGGGDLAIRFKALIEA